MYTEMIKNTIFYYYFNSCYAKSIKNSQEIICVIKKSKILKTRNLFNYTAIH